VDLLGAFPTFEDTANSLITYPRVRLGNDNMGVCKLPWVDVFNPDSVKAKDTDIYINPSSQELYAEFFNGMTGSELTWQEIFEMTDRDINLQRVMNAVRFGEETARFDWVPDRAIGPTEDSLYEAEGEYNDSETARILGAPLEDIRKMPTAGKRKALMEHRKKELSALIALYYEKRGWTPSGVPTVATLERLGLWRFLKEETRREIVRLNQTTSTQANAIRI